MKDEKKFDSPAYLSVKRLEKVISLISARSMTSLNPDYFLHHSFSSSDANLAIASLRFLGLIDENSNSTPLMAKMGFKGDAKTEAMVEMIKTAYHELYENVPEAHIMDKDELHNDFMHIYKISARVASAVVPAFIYLCEQAGLREQKSHSKFEKSINSASIKKITSKTSAPSKKISASIEADSSQTVIPFGESGLKLVIPVDVLTDTSIFDDYKELVAAITKFVNKYLSSKHQNKKDGTTLSKE